LIIPWGQNTYPPSENMKLWETFHCDKITITYLAITFISEHFIKKDNGFSLITC
jgi:hypothetical protein